MDASEWTFSEVLGISPKEYVRARSARGTLPARAVLKLCKELPVTYSKLACGDVDFETAAEHLRGNRAFVPRRYHQGARSRRRTAMTLFSFLETHFGKDERDRFMRELGVHEEAFRNPNDMISVHFTSDLCALLHEHGYSIETIVNMGAFSTRFNRQGPLGQTLAQLPTVHTIYEVVFDFLISNFDENWDYALKSISDDEAIVEVTEKEDARDELGMKGFGNIPTCYMRAGVGTAFPEYLGREHASMAKLSCIHQGDSSCRFSFGLSRYATKH